MTPATQRLAHLCRASSCKLSHVLPTSCDAVTRSAGCRLRCCRWLVVQRSVRTTCRSMLCRGVRMHRGMIMGCRLSVQRLAGRMYHPDSTQGDSRPPKHARHLWCTAVRCNAAHWASSGWPSLGTKVQAPRQQRQDQQYAGRCQPAMHSVLCINPLGC